MTRTIVYTIGHSTRSLDDFIAILKVYGINQVIDIRTIPRSRHNPQFNSDMLARKLRNQGVGYRHASRLGGLRHPKKAAESPNLGWRNASFRGFADYMGTDAFREGLERLIKQVRRKKIVIMCAEAVPWRCHRSLIGDALLIRDIQVRDIFSEHSWKPHTLTQWAKVHGRQITYPKTQAKKKALQK